MARSFIKAETLSLQFVARALGLVDDGKPKTKPPPMPPKISPRDQTTIVEPTMPGAANMLNQMLSKGKGSAHGRR